jgi:hypothetical protein
MAPPLAAALEPLAFLLGTWRGDGQGEYPTIRPFRYREEVRFWHTGKAFLVYTQRTEAADDGRALHAEMGYLRAVGADRVEMVLAQPTGFAEIETGTVQGRRIELTSTVVSRTPTAKGVSAVARTIWLQDDVLQYELGMAMDGGPLTHHLRARLHRAAD